MAREGYPGDVRQTAEIRLVVALADDRYRVTVDAGGSGETDERLGQDWGGNCLRRFV